MTTALTGPTELENVARQRQLHIRQLAVGASSTYFLALSAYPLGDIHYLLDRYDCCVMLISDNLA